jgi:UDP-glucose 4-epimerase
MALDEIVFEEACKAGVERICYASSACVYPRYLQEDAGSSYRLKEDDADPFVRDKAQADLEYGWAKLMGEMALKAYHKQHGLKCSPVRIFTAYGPRENETHAIIALIAKAYIEMDPYLIWGTGKQDRNFTYVQDIVDAMVLASEKIVDGSPVNAGREDRITIDGAAELLFEMIGWRPGRIEHDLNKPEGVASRAADLTRARDRLGWEPKFSYEEGFKRTIDWYTASKNKGEVAANLNRILIER